MTVGARKPFYRSFNVPKTYTFWRSKGPPPQANRFTLEAVAQNKSATKMACQTNDQFGTPFSLVI
jgi:hypothetical protein